MDQKAYLFSLRDMDESELYPLSAGLVAVFTARCPDSPSPNQDSCAVIPFDETSGIIVVADGAGGLPSGAKASELTIKAMRHALKAGKDAQTDLRSAILNGIDAANEKVLHLGVGAGTTLAVAEIHPRHMRSYHVGDSQILVIGQRGKIKLQTMSHSPVGYAVSAGMMNPQAAMAHAERHLVSNLVGQALMHIEIGPSIELSPKDTVIVASDGLFDNLLMAEIADMGRKGQLLSTCRELTLKAHSRMRSEDKHSPSKPDDLTLLAYRRRLSLS